MVGNDVVDLRDPESRSESLHPRFDTRVFTERERSAIAGSGDPERARWKLWAAKEAAYKLTRKLAPATIFSPRSFEVELTSESEAAVEHEGARCQVQYTENDGALHAVATCQPGAGKAVLSGWRRLEAGEIASGDPDAPSRAVRALLCERIASELGVAASELEVRRQGRVPVLWLRGARAPVDLSLSHHGDWLGFACEIEQPPAGGPVR
jgi:phosphopantetheinyl transferase (holo-ACP synthase)